MPREIHKVNGTQYTLAQLKDKIATIVKANIGKTLTGEDYDFAYWALTRRRPNLTTKPVIKAVEDNSGKHLQYHNGTEWENFSYYKACKGKVSCKRGDIQKAFRYEVYPQIKAFRERAESKLYRKGTVTIVRNQTHVDHIVPFHKLLSDFLDEQGLELESVEIKREDTGASYVSFLLVDRELAKAWYTYHEKYAQLRLISAKANMRKANETDLPLWRYEQKRKQS